MRNRHASISSQHRSVNAERRQRLQDRRRGLLRRLGEFGGASVASAGDVNGDGFADLIVGARYASPNGVWSGASYVVFGQAGGFAPNINLSSLDGATGFKISGESTYGRSGFSVASAGDVNGDGFDDVIVGSIDSPSIGSGASYVVFGKAAGFGSNIDVSSLDGSNGFRVIGDSPFDDNSHWSVASAGDLNGDGFDDLIVGARNHNTLGEISNSPESYVIFGRAPDSAVVRTGTSASQTLAGGAFDDVLAGMGGDDALFGNDGNDNLDGGDGNDELRGGAGGDVMGGGLGDDTYYVDAAQDVLEELSNQGTDTVHTTVSFTLAANVEILVADLDAGLALRGNGIDNTITGGGGNDALLGGNGSDVLIGGDGNDKLDGGARVDAMNGGDGNDLYYVDDTGDAIADSGGIDSIYTTVDHALGADFERLFADSDGDLILTGNSASNFIEGRGGNDIIDGGAGNDRLGGGGGMDMIRGGEGSDRLSGADGNDTLDGGMGSDALDGGIGRDRLNGGVGRDTLNGGLDADILTGGDNNDTFVYQSLGDSGILETDRDRITDFETGDIIDLSAIDAITGGAHDQFAFIGNAEFTASGQVRWETTQNGTLIEANTQDTLGADFSILLQGSHMLTADDFNFGSPAT